jgi:metal-responsive CopG/Arc/MetJ family transcriptional regulator
MYESKVTQMTSYVTIKLPKDLVEQIDDFIQKQNYGYASRAELVKDAVRSFLTKIKQDKSG